MTAYATMHSPLLGHNTPGHRHPVSALYTSPGTFALHQNHYTLVLTGLVKSRLHDRTTLHSLDDDAARLHAPCTCLTMTAHR